MSSISYVLTVVPVSDLQRAMEFYSAFLGRGPDEEPMEGIAEWRVGDSAWIQVSTDTEGMGRMTFSVAVDDVEKFRKERIDAGLALGEIVDYGFVKMVKVTDPDGNDVWALQETGDAA